jgi:hypothetical protein
MTEKQKENRLDKIKNICRDRATKYYSMAVLDHYENQVKHARSASRATR